MNEHGVKEEEMETKAKFMKKVNEITDILDLEGYTRDYKSKTERKQHKEANTIRVTINRTTQSYTDRKEHSIKYPRKYMDRRGQLKRDTTTEEETTQNSKRRKRQPQWSDPQEQSNNC